MLEGGSAPTSHTGALHRCLCAESSAETDSQATRLRAPRPPRVNEIPPNHRNAGGVQADDMGRYRHRVGIADGLLSHHLRSALTPCSRPEVGTRRLERRQGPTSAMREKLRFRQAGRSPRVAHGPPTGWKPWQ